MSKDEYLYKLWQHITAKDEREMEGEMEKTERIKTIEKNATRIGEEWTEYFFDSIRTGRGIDKPALENGIRWMYEDIFNWKMPRIFYCDSWVSLHETFKDNYLLIKKNVNDSLVHSLLYGIHQNIHEKIKLAIKKFINPIPLDKEAISCIYTSTEAMVSANIITNMMFPIYLADIRSRRTDEISLYLRSHNISASIYSGCSYYEYFAVHENFKCAEYENLKNFAKSCFISMSLYRNCVFAVQPPVYVLFNGQGRLHCLEGPAVMFRDNSCQYFINGRNVPAWVFERKDAITGVDFLNERNVDTRGAIYAVLGHKKMMEMLDAKTVHTSEIRHANGDVETVELIKTGGKFQEIGNQPFAWVKVTCPSTGTDYLLAVEPKYENAAEALASLSMFEEGEYSFNFRT
jgi:hypothetical protein